MVLQNVGEVARKSAEAHKFANWWKTEPVESKNEEQRLATVLIKSDDENAAKSCLDVLKQHDIDFNDMSALVKEDFAQMGLLDDAEHMMRSFKRLPTQNLSFQDICSNPEAETYNQLIFNEAYKNLNDLHIALIETCLNLRMDPPADMIVGDKNFASKFLVETLKELHGAAGVLQTELNQFGVEYEMKKSEPRKSWPQFILQFGATTLGITLIAYFIFKRSN